MFGLLEREKYFFIRKNEKVLWMNKKQLMLSYPIGNKTIVYFLLLTNISCHLIINSLMVSRLLAFIALKIGHHYICASPKVYVNFFDLPST